MSAPSWAAPAASPLAGAGRPGGARRRRVDPPRFQHRWLRLLHAEPTAGDDRGHHGRRLDDERRDAEQHAAAQPGAAAGEPPLQPEDRGARLQPPPGQDGAERIHHQLRRAAAAVRVFGQQDLQELQGPVRGAAHDEGEPAASSQAQHDPRRGRAAAPRAPGARAAVRPALPRTANGPRARTAPRRRSCRR